MKVLTRLKFLALGGVAYLFGTAQVHAASRVALAYDAAASCPSEGEFQAAVEARGGDFSGPRVPGSAWALRVSIAQDGTGFRGTLQATTDEATSTAREVHGRTCQEVADALAVVSATALNPQAESKSATKEESSPPPATKPPATAPTSPAAAAVAEGRLRATGSVNNAQVPVEAGTLRFDKARILSVFGGAQYGLLPNTLTPRFDLSLSAANFVTTPGGKSYIDGPIPRLHVGYLGPSTYQTDDTSSEAQGFLFALGVCWSPHYDTRGLVALLCAEYGAGWMNVQSKDAQGNKLQNKDVGLGFAGLGIETQYHLGSAFDVGLKLGSDFFVNPISAERPDGSTIFQSSGLTGYGMLSLGVQF